MGWWQIAGDYLTALFRAVGQTLTLDPLALAQADRFGWSVPIGVAVIGGISLMIGQSIMLAVNRVSRVRGALTLLASGFGLVVVAGLAALLVAGLGRLALGNSAHFAELLPSVLLSYSPYWFGFLVLLPYSGEGVARLLQVWQLIALWTLLTPVLATDRLTALVLAAVVLLASVAVSWLVAHSPLRLRERIFRAVSGSQWTTSGDLRAAARLEPGELS